jgi:hypothetical protein
MTAQACDKILIEGRENRLYCEPLELYWNDYNPKPDFVPPHTACWRGYIAFWTVEATKLHLTGIDTENESLKIEKVFPGKEAPIFADWFTGELRIPQGEMLQYVHMFYQSRFESDLFLLVDNGIVLNEWVVDNRCGSMPG